MPKTEDMQKKPKAAMPSAGKTAGGTEKEQKRRRPARPSVKSEKAKTVSEKAKKPEKAAKTVPEKAKAVPERKADAPKKRRGRRTEESSSAPVRIIPLGGVGEIGKNMTVIESGDDIIVLDCGLTFPDGELLGVDLVIPDTTYLQRNRHKLRALFITHGHEDHIGALPYFLRDFDAPIYCTALTEALIRHHLSEHREIKSPQLVIKKPGDTVNAGCFSVEFINVNHSIPDAVAFVIKTPQGNIVFTGDFKIDTTPVSGKMTDLIRLGEVAKSGVRLLLMDSTNAEREGLAMSERLVVSSIEREFRDCRSRIIIACFASNVHRIQKIIEVAEKNGRKVAVSGRSMDNILKVGAELKYITAKKTTFIELSQVKNYPPEKLCIITTGSQGEPMSALYRMAYSSHKQVDVGPGDKILIAASPIPGNEKAVYQMINELVRKGAEVVYERLAEMHVSGHACREELKMMLAVVRPEYFMPVHGEYRHLLCNAKLAEETGVAHDNIFLSELGRVLELKNGGAAFNGSVPFGRVLVDGYGVGDIGNAVLKERKVLAEDGVLVVSAAVDPRARTIVSPPVITSRGFVYVKDSEELLSELESNAYAQLGAALSDRSFSVRTARERISSATSDLISKKTNRSPFVFTILTEIE